MKDTTRKKRKKTKRGKPIHLFGVEEQIRQFGRPEGPRMSLMNVNGYDDNMQDVSKPNSLEFRTK